MKNTFWFNLEFSMTRNRKMCIQIGFPVITCKLIIIIIHQKLNNNKSQLKMYTTFFRIAIKKEIKTINEPSTTIYWCGLRKYLYL